MEQPDHYRVLVSNAGDADISVLQLDTTAATLQALERVSAADALMPMTLSADATRLYAASRAVQPALLEYALGAGMTTLSHCRTVAISSSLAYVMAEPSGRFVLGASYGGNCLEVYSVARLDAGDATPVQRVPGLPHAHAVIASADGRDVYVSLLGSDRVLCLHLDARAAAEPLRVFDTVHLPAGFGPRHLRLSADNRWLYVLSEFRGVVAVFARDMQSGRIALHSIAPGAPALAHLKPGHARAHATAAVQPDAAALAALVWAADLHLGRDGRFLYLSERNSSQLIVYRLSATGGELEYAGAVAAPTQPRGFAIDPSGHYLVACGERAAHVVLYRIDPSSGMPAPVSQCAGGRGANWVEIVALPA